MVYASFSSHSSICHCQQSGRKVNERNSSFVSGCNKSANIRDNTSAKTDEQTMPVGAEFVRIFIHQDENFAGVLVLYKKIEFGEILVKDFYHLLLSVSEILEVFFVLSPIFFYFYKEIEMDFLCKEFF